MWRSVHGGEMEECCVMETGVYLLHLFFCYGKKRLLSWSWLSCSPPMPSQLELSSGTSQGVQAQEKGCCAADTVTVSQGSALAHSLPDHRGHTTPLPSLHPFHPSPLTACPCWVLTGPTCWEQGPLVPQQGAGWFPALTNMSGVAPRRQCCSLRMSGSCGMRC